MYVTGYLPGFLTPLFFFAQQRADLPENLSPSAQSMHLDISVWGPPTGSWLAVSCNIPQFFTPQRLVIDVTLCGDWSVLCALWHIWRHLTAPSGPGTFRVGSSYLSRLPRDTVSQRSTITRVLRKRYVSYPSFVKTSFCFTR